MENDDRQSNRQRTAIRVRYKTHEEFITRHTVDLSDGGLFIRTLHFLPINTVLKLYLLLPGDEAETPVIARVAHVLDTDKAALMNRSPGMGFEFLDLAPEAKERLHKVFLSTLKTDEPPPPLPDLAGYRILLVEDEGVTQRKIGSLFLRRGIRLSLAGSGAEALTKALRQRPDLILSDIRMPSMDGWALLRLVKARSEIAGVPFVFLTAQVSEDERRKAYELGADDFIPKATPPEEILYRVARTLGRYREDPGRMSQRRLLQGDLNLVPLPTLLQMLAAERKTGALYLKDKECHGKIELREGAPVTCELAPFDLSGRDALIELLDWNEGHFEFMPGDVSGPDEIGMNVVQLLVEHAHQRDYGKPGRD